MKIKVKGSVIYLKMSVDYEETNFSIIAHEEV